MQHWLYSSPKILLWLQLLSYKILNPSELKEILKPHWLSITTHHTKTGAISKRHYQFHPLYWKHATLDVSSLYTNIPQTEGIDYICHNTKITISIIYQFPQMIYGNFCCSYSKQILSSSMKNSSYKHLVLLWEIRHQLPSLPFYGRPRKMTVNC